MSREISTIVTGMSYLEGPRWHDQRIWFSDFYTCRVYSAAEDGSDIRTEAEVAQQPSGLGWLPDGRLLIVSMRDGRLLRREADGTLVCHADLSGYINGHLNDMVVDTHGRVFVGEFGFDLMGGADFKPAGLLRVDPDGTITKAAGDMWFPNGSVITEDGTLLVDETFGNRVSAFDITDDGTLANRRTWAKFGEPPSDSELGKHARPGRRRPRRLLPGRGRGAMDSRRPRRPGHPGAPRRRDHRGNPGRHRRIRLHARRSRWPHLVHLRRARLPGTSAQERSRGMPDGHPRRHTPCGFALTCSRSRPLSRDRTRCPRCPASRGTTRCRHRRIAVVRVLRRARPVVRIRPQVPPGALPPRARCRPARQDAADS